MSIKYVHKEYLLNKIEEYNITYKRGKKAGIRKNQELYDNYTSFYNEKYLIMFNKIKSLTFDINNVDSFNECSNIFNSYWKDLKQFMKNNTISNNSKIHTTFMEEFSCYFLCTLPNINNYDVFTTDVFAGLKIKSDYTITQIKKDVDFCIGKEISIPISEQDKITLKVPAISVEVKSYVDATMLGEVMNTSRKIKGANPGSKSILLTWVNSFADEHAIEAAYDSSLDEIIVLSKEKRVSGKQLKIIFTSKGLHDYYEVMLKAMADIRFDNEVPQIGHLLSYVRHIESFNESEN